MVSLNTAAGIYTKAASQIAEPSKAPFLGATTPSVSFAELVQGGAQTSLNIMRGSEGISASALQGKADMADVVTAVAQAEITLQTVMSIRDRMVNAWQEMMRMPI